MTRTLPPAAAATLYLAATACAAPSPSPSDAPSWSDTQAPGDRVASVMGLSGPEAVKYDPDQDVYFVSNFSGSPTDRDADGFVSRVSPDGEVLDLRFMTGGPGAPLHAPRGMALSGDTLWVADVDGVHGFHRGTGEPVAFVDLSGFEPGFLNDVAVGPDGALYVTDTGGSRVFRVRGRSADVAVEGEAVGLPNGIAWDAAAGRFVLAPWGGSRNFVGFRPGGARVEPVTTLEAGGFFDGVEPWGGRWLVASQADSSLHVLDRPAGPPLVRLDGTPADIAVDTRRGRVAVPFVGLDRVDVYRLPAGGG